MMRLMDYSHDDLPWDEEERWRRLAAAEELYERRQEDRADGERVNITLSDRGGKVNTAQRGDPNER